MGLATDFLVSAASLPGVATEPGSAGGHPIRNLLCPIDFSEFSLKAFQYARGLARRFGSRLFVQHTVELPPIQPIGEAESAAFQQGVQASLRRSGMEMRRLTAFARLQLRDLEIVVNEGDVCERLAQSIDRNRIDLVVMGTHGRRGFLRPLLGSVTETILRRSPCPVLTVGRPVSDFVTPDEVRPCHLKTILLPTDFSRESVRALTMALDWAAGCSAKIILFHAVEKDAAPKDGKTGLSPGNSPSLEKEIGQAWEALQDRLPAQAAKNIEIESEVRHGNPAEQIIRFAEENHIDLIMMGSRGTGKAGHPWGSTTSRVVRDGRFPVLAVPHHPA